MRINVLNFVKKTSTGKKTLIFFLIFLAFNFLFNLFIIPQFNTYSGNISMLDVSRGYDIHLAEKFITKTPKEALSFYLRCFLPVDLVFPIIYALFFSFTLAFLFSKLTLKTNKIELLLLFPFLMAATDYIENIGIAFMIVMNPKFNNVFAAVIMFFSSLKWHLGGIISLSIIITFIILMIKIIKNKFFTKK